MKKQNNAENNLGFNPEKLEGKAKFDEAFEMVLNDEPVEPVDAVFLHAMSYDDDDELFPLAASYVRDGKAKFIVVNGSDGRGFYDPTPGKAWAGKDEYVRRLKELGVPEDQIKESKPALHTRQANEAYLAVAKENGWKTAVTLNQPQQLLRAQLGQIQSMKGNQADTYEMRVYAAFPLPWNEEKIVRGPQGQDPEPRYKLLEQEYKRILQYQGTGELASFDEFFNYIKSRQEVH